MISTFSNDGITEYDRNLLDDYFQFLISLADKLGISYTLPSAEKDGVGIGIGLP